MFTGLIEDVATLHACRRQGHAAKLDVETALPLADLRIGDSIAVNGACLTVEAIRANARIVVFHTLAETLRRTTLGALASGSPLNLERALRLGDRLGGHLVQGHVDATACLESIGREGDDYVVRVNLPDRLRALVIPKGSIALDGISLTIAELTADSLALHIIPHTWEATNLRAARPGTRVNLEGDMIGKYILRQTQTAHAAPPAALSMTDLERSGFLP